MKWWEYLDILSVEAKLYLHGKNRFVNKFGIFLSILSVVSVFILSSYFLIVYIRKTQLNVVFYEPYNFNEVSITFSNNPLIWSLVDQNNQIVDPRLVQVIPMQVKSQSGTEISKLSLEIESCQFMNDSIKKNLNTIIKNNFRLILK